MKHLREKFPSVKVLNVFSDGAGSQFKQRFLFWNLHYREQDRHLKLTWNFFATSHGKGVVDELGGTVKRAVWRHVRSGQVHITTAEEYAKIAEQRNPKIHLQFIAEGDIDQIKPQLDAKWEDVLAVPKTHKMHCIILKGKGMVMVSDTSDSKEYTIVSLRKPETQILRKRQSPHWTSHKNLWTGQKNCSLSQKSTQSSLWICVFDNGWL